MSAILKMNQCFMYFKQCKYVFYKRYNRNISHAFIIVCTNVLHENIEYAVFFFRFECKINNNQSRYSCFHTHRISSDLWRGGGRAVRGVPSLPSENADIAKVVWLWLARENYRVGNLPEPGGRHQVAVIGSTTL